MMVVVKFYYISKAFQCVNVCGHVFWRQFAVVYRSCQDVRNKIYQCKSVYVS